MNNDKLISWSIIVSMAGLLFGFDTVVISGAEQALQKVWMLSGFYHGIIMSMALWGTVVGSLFGGIPTDKLGRKNTLLVIGVLYFISAVGSGLAWDPISFSIFRFLGGLGVGASTVAAPVYISEIAPSHRRGRLVAMYQFNIVLGILVAYVSNYLLKDFGTEPWRWMMGVEAIPAFIYSLLVLIIPNSPRWLYLFKGDKEKATKVLKEIDPEMNVEREFQKMDESVSSKNIKRESILEAKYFPLIVLAFFISFFNQMSGINAFLYYSTRIFELAGLGGNAALLSGVGVGIVNLVFTLLGVMLIDRVGRKTLMYWGSIGYIVSLVLVATAFALHWQGMVVPLFLFIFIAAHAIGQGAVIWVFISEIFPTIHRGMGQAIGTSVHWVMAALITFITPLALGELANPAPVFAFFAFMMVLQLVWVHYYMPETKNASVDELYKGLIKKD